MPRDAMRRARSGSGGVRAACNYDNFNRQLSGITPAPGARPPAHTAVGLPDGAVGELVLALCPRLTMLRGLARPCPQRLWG